MRALVVEDDPRERRVMTRLLHAAGLEVESASTLQLGRARTTENPPHLLVLDLLLPDGNGIELLEHIRSHGLPITVAVVSGASNELLADALVRHPEGFFDKPLDLERFGAWLERIIESYKRSAE